MGHPHDNPLVSSSEQKQLKNYVRSSGSGAVVYLVGVQSNYSMIERGKGFAEPRKFCRAYYKRFI